MLATTKFNRFSNCLAINHGNSQAICIHVRPSFFRLDFEPVSRCALIIQRLPGRNRQHLGTGSIVSFGAFSRYKTCPKTETSGTKAHTGLVSQCAVSLKSPSPATSGTRSRRLQRSSSNSASSSPMADRIAATCSRQAGPSPVWTANSSVVQAATNIWASAS